MQGKMEIIIFLGAKLKKNFIEFMRQLFRPLIVNEGVRGIRP